MTEKIHRKITAQEVLDWRNQDAPIMRIRTDTDATPNGLSLAMVPLQVRWDKSSGFGPDDTYLIRNVNIASNPVGGVTVLATVRAAADSVESVEFVIVLSKVAGKETEAGHAMLRFNFREDKQPQILARSGESVANFSSISDLIISWEAWRPPTASFDAVAGLDPNTYALTPRGFLGSTRCLTDSILDRPWVCYPLNLPDVPHAANLLFHEALVLADAVGRQTVSGIMGQAIEETSQLDDEDASELDKWKKAKADLDNSVVPDNPIADILEGKIKYHLLKRSCITMALTTVDRANCQIHMEGELGEPKRVRIAPTKMPSSLDALVDHKRVSTLLRIPATLFWLMQNQTVIPGKAYQLLDEVGLLTRDGGKIVKAHFDNRNQSPYGRTQDNIIY